MLNALYPFGQDAEGPGSGSVVSNLAGSFEGWAGQTIFRLRNGQVWQQTSPGYLYRYAYMPRVAIFPTREGYRMKVEGVREAVAVRRVR